MIREELQEKVAAKAEAAAERTYEQRQERTIQVAEKLRDRVLDAPTRDIDLTTALRTIPRYAPLEAAYAGQPIGFDAGQVESIVAGVMRAARELFAAALEQAGHNAQPTVVLAYVDQRFPGAVAELIEGTAEEVEA